MQVHNRNVPCAHTLAFIIGPGVVRIAASPQDEIMEEERKDYDLGAVFTEAASEYGYEDVTAEFAEFDELRLKWIRHGEWARFFVSDYLKDAPRDVMASIAGTLMKKICCVEGSSYSEEVCRWLTDEGFVERNQPLYIRRKGDISPVDEGRHKDLRASFGRLVSSGLLHEDPSVYLGWDETRSGQGAGRFSVLLKVAAVTSRLDTERVSDEALDFALYSLALNIDLGFAPCRKRNEREYADLMASYPDAGRLTEELARIGVSVR